MSWLTQIELRILDSIGEKKEIGAEVQKEARVVVVHLFLLTFAPSEKAKICSRVSSYL